MKLRLFFVGVVCLFLSKTIHPQTASSLYVETTKFKKYATTTPGMEGTEYRYDELHHLVLKFVNYKDVVVTIELYDYDANGNRIGYTALSFKKEKGRRDRYILNGEFDQKKFAEAIQKTLDLLDKE